MAAEYFLKIDKITGDSTKVSNQIEVDSFSWGATQQTSHEGDGGVTASGVNMDHFTFTMKVSSASPKLMAACSSGDPVGNAVLTARRPAKGKQEVYLTWTMEGVIVSSYRHNSADSTDSNLPTDTFTLAFNTIKEEYKPQGSDGSHGAAVSAGYNLKTMQKL
jgi:type VI secretion system secreted protein Hcp